MKAFEALRLLKYEIKKLQANQKEPLFVDPKAETRVSSGSSFIEYSTDQLIAEIRNEIENMYDKVINLSDQVINNQSNYQ